MALELHKRGYQRLAIYPGLAASGMHWRCEVLPLEFLNISDRGEVGYKPTDETLVARYSTGQDNAYFGWTDATNDTARELADKFEDRFAEICRLSNGLNLGYSGWLVYILGQAEAGELPLMYWDSPAPHGALVWSHRSNNALQSPPLSVASHRSRDTRQDVKVEEEVFSSKTSPHGLIVVPDQHVKQFSPLMESLFEMLHRRVTQSLTIPEHIESVIGIVIDLRQKYYSMRDHLEADDGVSQYVVDALPEIDVGGLLSTLHAWEQNPERAQEEYDKRDTPAAAVPLYTDPEQQFANAVDCWKQYRFTLFEANRALAISRERIATDAPEQKPRRYPWLELLPGS
jgi:hypothetical protein